MDSGNSSGDTLAIIDKPSIRPQPYLRGRDSSGGGVNPAEGALIYNGKGGESSWSSGEMLSGQPAKEARHLARETGHLTTETSQMKKEDGQMVKDAGLSMKEPNNNEIRVPVVPKQDEKVQIILGPLVNFNIL